MLPNLQLIARADSFDGKPTPGTVAEVVGSTLGRHCSWRVARVRRPTLNRTGFIGGPIPREDGPNGPTQQVFPRVA